MERVLTGRVALVTGVSRRKGIGFAVANRLAAMGADVFCHGFSGFDSEQSWGADSGGLIVLQEELRQRGTRIEFMEADLADPSAPSMVIAAAIRALSHIDILIANHAYSTSGALEEITAEQIDAHLLVNVRATLLLVKEFAAQHDDAKPGGRVILFTSGQHLHPMPGELAYIASKGALHQLTASLAAHLAPRGITVNTIDPGATDTGWATPDVYESVRDAHPQKRWGTPEDAARLISWLVLDDAAWITGQIINSRGGA
jgi:3-oxoacyl-[acyl-carrier protein] reductase